MMLTRMVRGVIARANIVGIDAAEAIDGHDGHREAMLLEEPAGFDDRRMLDGAGDDVVALVLQRPGHALEGQVVGLAASAGEDDLVALGSRAAPRPGCAPARVRPCARSSPMSARRIAEMILQKRPHRGSDGRIDRRAGVVVEVDARPWSEHQHLVRFDRGGSQLVHGAAARPFHDLASPMPRASMQVPHSRTRPLAASTRFSIRSML